MQNLQTIYRVRVWLDQQINGNKIKRERENLETSFSTFFWWAVFVFSFELRVFADVSAYHVIF